MRRLLHRSFGLQQKFSVFRTWCEIRGSIVVSIPACHAGNPGSIPGLGAFVSCLKFLFASRSLSSLFRESCEAKKRGSWHLLKLRFSFYFLQFQKFAFIVQLSCNNKEAKNEKTNNGTETIQRLHTLVRNNQTSKQRKLPNKQTQKKKTKKKLKKIMKKNQKRWNLRGSNPRPKSLMQNVPISTFWTIPWQKTVQMSTIRKRWAVTTCGVNRKQKMM